MLYVDEKEQSVVADALRLYLGVTNTLNQQGETQSAGGIAAAERLLERLQRGPGVWWPSNLNSQADAEGWNVFSSDGVLEIQRYDELGRFSSDDEAALYVMWKAASGSELHSRALAVTLAPFNQRPFRYEREIAEIEARPVSRDEEAA